MIIQKENGRKTPVTYSTRDTFKMVAKTMMGLEEILAEELRECGAQNIECGARAVTFEGDMRVLYRANYTCRTALAILKPFAEFEANDEQELYNKVYQIKWEKILDVDCTFMIDSTTSGEVFTHSYYAALKTKDAIVDRFRRNFGQRPTIDTESPDYKFNLHIRDNQVTLLINSSGDSLHKRGYRQAVGIAPINEVLAAGMIKLAGWKCDTNFYDPMCGSGTLLIEAAMLANNIPAQYYRGGKFAFKRWKEFNLGEWKSVKEQEDRKIGSGDFDCEIWGNDLDMQVLEQAEKNLEYTKLHKDVMLYNGSFEDQDPPEGRTLIVTNPPYGERIKIEDLNAMYELLGDTFKKKYGENCDVWLITSDFDAMKHIGLKPSAKIPLLNGQLDCRFLHFELYNGSKKDKFKTDSDE
ncbi:MAG: class I SAM-dependent RNA methyltransferase [Bacteroidales bacterium]|nr:class I SAM-dependent RNA methyltransferase [Candidatus Colimorpha merdihippi]MCQ2282422.1 class I SAM-dependent RNA methyltransferase [Bacteroidales bacterium]